jgi:iron complex transport system permease protein
VTAPHVTIAGVPGTGAAVTTARPRVRAASQLPLCHARVQRRRRVIVALLVAVAGATVLAATIGAAPVALRDVPAVLGERLGLLAAGTAPPEADSVVWSIRLPRILLTLCVGATLGLAGATLQGIFRNPLADPGLIGVSSGAALATAVTIVLGHRWLQQLGDAAPWALAVAGFGGGLVVTFALLTAARRHSDRLVLTLLLGGIALNGFAGAATGALTVIATDAQLRSLSFWMLGSLGGATWPLVAAACVPMLLCIGMLLRYADRLDLLLLGEREAGHLGLDVQRTTRGAVIWAALGVGSAVAFAGGIGFVGLVVPHLARLGLGASHRGVLPTAAVGGALLLLVADTVARRIAIPVELPVGVITALLGAPLLVWMAARRLDRPGWSAS